MLQFSEVFSYQGKIEPVLDAYLLSLSFLSELPEGGVVEQKSFNSNSLSDDELHRCDPVFGKYKARIVGQQNLSHVLIACSGFARTRASVGSSRGNSPFLSPNNHPNESNSPESLRKKLAKVYAHQTLILLFDLENMRPDILIAFPTESYIVNATISLDHALVAYTTLSIYEKGETFYEVFVSEVTSKDFNMLSLGHQASYQRVQFLDSALKGSSPHATLLILNQSGPILLIPLALRNGELPDAPPQAEKIAESFIWYQFELASQCLYYLYLRPSKLNSLASESFLKCLAFTHKGKWDVKFDMQIPLEKAIEASLFEVPNAHEIYRLPCSHSLPLRNLHIELVFMGGGALCLCLQHPFLKNSLSDDSDEFEDGRDAPGANLAPLQYVDDARTESSDRTVGSAQSNDLETDEAASTATLEAHLAEKNLQSISVEYTIFVLHHLCALTYHVPLHVPTCFNEDLRLYFTFAHEYLVVYVPGVYMQLLDVSSMHDPLHHLVFYGDEVPGLPPALLTKSSDSFSKQGSSSQSPLKTGPSTHDPAPLHVSLDTSLSPATLDDSFQATSQNPSSEKVGTMDSRTIDSYPFLTYFDLVKRRSPRATFGPAMFDVQTGNAYRLSFSKEAIYDAFVRTKHVDTRVKIIHLVGVHIGDVSLTRKLMEFLVGKCPEEFTFDLMKEYLVARTYTSLKEDALDVRCLRVLPITSIPPLVKSPVVRTNESYERGYGFLTWDRFPLNRNSIIQGLKGNGDAVKVQVSENETPRFTSQLLDSVRFSSSFVTSSLLPTSTLPSTPSTGYPNESLGPVTPTTPRTPVGRQDGLNPYRPSPSSSSSRPTQAETPPPKQSFFQQLFSSKPKRQSIGSIELAPSSPASVVRAHPDEEARIKQRVVEMLVLHITKLGGVNSDTASRWGTAFKEAQLTQTSELYKVINDMRGGTGIPSEDRVQLLLLEALYHYIVDSFSAFPQGFHQKFAELAHSCLPRALFLQYVEARIVKISEAIVDKVVDGFTNTKADMEMLVILLAHTDCFQAQQALHKIVQDYPSSDCKRILAENEVLGILADSSGSSRHVHEILEGPGRVDPQPSAFPPLSSFMKFLKDKHEASQQRVGPGLLSLNKIEEYAVSPSSYLNSDSFVPVTF